MPKVANLLMMEAKGVPVKHKLLAMAAKPSPTKKQLMMKLVGVPSRMPTKYYNKKGRQFFLTLKGKYVVRQNGKSLYGLKAAGPNAATAPKAIRPKRYIIKSVVRTPNSHPLMPMSRAKRVRWVKAKPSSLVN
jgi:hypothetical protein